MAVNALQAAGFRRRRGLGDQKRRRRRARTGRPGRAAVVGSLPDWASPAARLGAVNPHARRTVTIALTPRDEAGAVALATAESTPGNREYRQRISAADYLARFAPTQDAANQVRSWLSSQGLRVSAVSNSREMIGLVLAAYGGHPVDPDGDQPVGLQKPVGAAKPAASAACSVGPPRQDSDAGDR